MNHDGHDHGLAHDLKILGMGKRMDRRDVLRLLAGASLVPLFGCSGGAATTTPATTETPADGGTGGASTGDAGDTTPGTCSKIPEETGGPYPGDGSNGPNALTLSDIVRSDIRTSIGTLSGTATGIPLTVTLKVVNASASCTALAGYAVYIWHCDQAGNYSMYTITDQNYLRGVQETNANGEVTFNTIFPAAYSGRWPHIHFEVYASLDAAKGGGDPVSTSQLALPEDVSAAVYATPGYEASVGNLSRTSLATDNVFSDGSTQQVPAITGSVAAGYAATLTVAVAG